MAGTLTQTVLADGEIYAEGTERTGRAAKAIPNGPWWSDHEEYAIKAARRAARKSDPEQQPTDPPETPEGDPEQPLEAEQEPPRSGAGSGLDAWQAYARQVGVDVADDAKREDIIAAVDAATGTQ